MNELLSKLGISTPERINTVDDVWKVYEVAGFKRPGIGQIDFNEARKLKKHLDTKNEMLEALIECVTELAEHYGEVGYSTIDNAHGVIEKATGKTWEEIKELLE